MNNKNNISFKDVFKMTDVKITIVKKLANKDLIEAYHTKPEGPLECSSFKVGDEYISKGIRIPEGFCSWAWADIHKDVAILAFGGNYSSVKKEGVGIACCTDGFKPVIFKLERL